MSLLCFVYTSTPAFRLDATTVSHEVRDILQAARRRNPALGITGGLLFTESFFLQVLEGSGGAIEDVVGRIADDPRHTQIRQLALIEIAHRRFEAWSMAHVKADTVDFKLIERTIAGAEKLSGPGCERLVGLMAGAVGRRPAISIRPHAAGDIGRSYL